MDIMDGYTLIVRALIVITLVVVFVMVCMSIYRLFFSSNIDHYDNMYHRILLPDSPYLDIQKLDMTRSERGIPLTEAIIDLKSHKM